MVIFAMIGMIGSGQIYGRVFDMQNLAVSFQLSAISFQPSAISYQLSAHYSQLTTFLFWVQGFSSIRDGQVPTCPYSRLFNDYLHSFLTTHYSILTTQTRAVRCGRSVET